MPTNIPGKVFKTVKSIFGKEPAQKKAEKYQFDLYGRYAIALVKGKGSKVWDDEHNEYIDALSGIAVNSLRHSLP
jgi:acetylornithine/succinyldiaminopimelate/putrescine aminotransferase